MHGHFTALRVVLLSKSQLLMGNMSAKFVLSPTKVLSALPKDSFGESSCLGNKLVFVLARRRMAGRPDGHLHKTVLPRPPLVEKALGFSCQLIHDLNCVSAGC